MRDLTLLSTTALALWTTMTLALFAPPSTLRRTSSTRLSRLSLSPDEERLVTLFDNVRPSVVYISTLSRQFNPILFNVMEIPAQTGSGFIWDSQGHIVTNAHVLEAGRGTPLTAKSSEVFLVTLLEPASTGTTSTRRSFRTRIKGIDSEKDIAVLEVLPPSNDDPVATVQPPILQPLKHGSSSSLRVGQTAIAIGNPFGLDLTLTTGVVSGLGRTVGVSSGSPSKALFDMVQTDASINPGNSGGPLLDSQGSLIGMNTAIFSTSGASAGIGFAIPVDTLKVVVELLIRDGGLRKPKTGLTLLGGYAAKALGVEKGLLVARVEKGSPADSAGLRGSSAEARGLRMALGDVILSVDGKSVSIEADFARAVSAANLNSGEELVSLHISRALLPLNEDGNAGGNTNANANANAKSNGGVTRREMTVRMRLSR